MCLAYCKCDTGDKMKSLGGADFSEAVQCDFNFVIMAAHKVYPGLYVFLASTLLSG